MVKIEPFQVEQWMDKYETTPGVLNIAETCAASVSVDDLVAFSSPPTANPLASVSATKMTYGAIPGSLGLRQNIADMLNSLNASSAGKSTAAALPADNVVITQGAIGANYLSLYTLVGPGDHVVCVYPTYQQLYSFPKSLGAEVSLWALREEQGYVPDVDQLETLVKANTKLIIINNSNNPMGVPIPQAVLERIVAFARSRGITLLSDEVYLPLYHGDDASAAPPSVASLGYDNVVVTGSLSKAFALAGLRVGWAASPSPAIVKALLAARDYTTISVSQLDDAVARYALSPPVRIPLLKRNIELARTNLELLAAFVDKWPKVCAWTRPTAGTTAFVQFRKASTGEVVDDTKFCVDVLDETKVMIVPGSRCFGGDKDFAGFVRIGYVSETDVLKEGLALLDQYVKKHLA